MIFNAQQALRSLILLAFTGLIFKLHYTGEITKYINPKYLPLSQIASVIFLVLFFIQITRIMENKKTAHIHDHSDSCGCAHDHHEHKHDHGDQPLTVSKVLGYIIIIFPLVTGFFIPAKTLDASIAAKKGGMDVITKKQQENSEAGPTDPVEPSINTQEPLPNPNKEITQAEMDVLIQEVKLNQNIVMTDELFYLYYEEIAKDIDAFKGRTISLTGFVYKEEGFTDKQLVLSRFLITHCVADASIIGFLTELDEAPDIQADTWIEASGVIDVTTYNGSPLPFIKITEWKKVAEPKEPYVYPLNVRIL